MKNKNCIWGHDFDNWVIKERQDLIRADTKGKVGISITQERVCKKCGYVELDVQTEYTI